MKGLLAACLLLAAPAQAAPPPSPLSATELKELRKNLEPLVRADPEDAVSWRRLGLVCNGLGDVECAEKSFLRVVEILPEDAGAYYMLGLIYEKRKMKSKAVEAWQACLKHAKDPKLRAVAQKHLEALGP